MRGSAEISLGNVDTLAIFWLPTGARPKELLRFPVAIGDSVAGTALLLVHPDGQVQVQQASVPNQNEVYVGDIEFRPDA